MKKQIKRLAALLLACCLTGCSAGTPQSGEEKIPAPGAELLPTGIYEMTKTDLLEEIQPTGNSCLSGNVLYYSLSKSEDDFLTLTCMPGI